MLLCDDCYLTVVKWLFEESVRNGRAVAAVSKRFRCIVGLALDAYIHGMAADLKTTSEDVKRLRLTHGDRALVAAFNMNADIFSCETSHSYPNFKSCEVWHGFSLSQGSSASSEVRFQYQVMVRDSVANDQVAYMMTHFSRRSVYPGLLSTQPMKIADIHGILHPDDLRRFRASKSTQFTHVRLLWHNYFTAIDTNWFTTGLSTPWWRRTPQLRARSVDGEIEMSLLSVCRTTSTFLPISNEKGPRRKLSGKPRRDCSDTMLAPAKMKQILLGNTNIRRYTTESTDGVRTAT
jgi:hypothetical protein